MPCSCAHVVPSQALSDVINSCHMWLTLPLISRLGRSVCAVEGFILLAELCERFPSQEIVSDTLMLIFVLTESEDLKKKSIHAYFSMKLFS